MIYESLSLYADVIIDTMMEYLASNTFGTTFYASIAAIVIYCVAQAYLYNLFFQRTFRVVVLILVAFSIFFLWYRFGTGYTSERMNEQSQLDSFYVWWAALHGILSSLAILLTCSIAVFAESSQKRGENFYRNNKKFTFFFIMLWPTALLFGVMLSLR